MAGFHIFHRKGGVGNFTATNVVPTPNISVFSDFSAENIFGKPGGENNYSCTQNGISLFSLLVSKEVYWTAPARVSISL